MKYKITTQSGEQVGVSVGAQVAAAIAADHGYTRPDLGEEVQRLERGMIQLAAEEALNDTGEYFEPERIARYARKKNIGYSEARRTLTAALSESRGEADSDRGDVADRAATLSHERGINFSDAAREIITGEPLVGTTTGVPSTPSGRGLELTNEAIRSRMEAANLSYSEAASRLVEEGYIYG